MDKSLKQKTVLIFDTGSFTPLAQRLTKEFGRVLYTSPHEGNGFPESRLDEVGTGIEGVERVSSIWDYADTDEVDLYVFTDCYYLAEQEYLKRHGKLVWGSGKTAWMERDKHRFYEWIDKQEMPISETNFEVGIESLAKNIKPDEFIKISNYRGDLECVDEKTEIFTENGWQYFKNLNGNEKVLSMDMETRKTDFYPINHYFKSFYEGKMYEIKNEKVDLLVTPLHKFFKKSTLTKKKWDYLPINQIHSKLESPSCGFHLPVKFEWDGKDINEYTIKNAYYSRRNNKERIKDKNIPINIWLEFLGWFISEGSLTLKGKAKNKYCITISQSEYKNSDKWNEIKDCLKKLGYNYHLENHQGFSIYNKSLFYDLANTCYKNTRCVICGKSHCSHIKKIPQYIKKLTKNKIQIFLDAFVKGDGNRYKKEITFYSSSHDLLSDLQELIFKIGKLSVIRYRKKRSHLRNGKMFIDRVKNGKVSILNVEPTIIKKQIRTIKYSGFVYDVNVEPYHSIFVRRNGKAVWTGNTLKYYDKERSDFRLKEMELVLNPFDKTYETIRQKKIDGIEIGGDYYTVDGELPKNVMWGVECKDSYYYGKISPYDSLPEQIRYVDSKLVEVFKEELTRTHFSHEMRVDKNKEPFFTDATLRMPNPPYQLHLALVENLGEIMYHGAMGKMIEPEYIAKYGVIATFKSPTAEGFNLPIKVSDKAKPFTHVMNLAIVDGEYFAVNVNDIDECGSVCGIGDTIWEARDNCENNASEVKADSLVIDVPSEEDIKKSISELQKYGVIFK
jgi:hypothetical protein